MKGIAISFLLFYHCFSKKFRMGGVYVDFAPLSRGTAMIGSVAVWFSALGCLLFCLYMDLHVL